jgi:polygalacturonase
MLTCWSALYLILFVQYTASQVYHVKDFGAIGDGIADDTLAVRAALSNATASNGGRVIFDAGYIFLTGCFNVTSNVILDVQGTIKASINVTNYEYIPLLPW